MPPACPDRGVPRPGPGEGSRRDPTEVSDAFLTSVSAPPNGCRPNRWSANDLGVEPPLGRRLYLGQRAVADVLDRRLAQRGASLWNWVLLREAANADGSSQRELARLMRIEPSTLVRHLDRLEADGYVERRPDPDDRRRAQVFVTRAGRERLTQLQEVALGMDAELRALLTPEEVEVLGDVLMRLHHHFTEPAGTDASGPAQESVRGRS